MQQGTNVAKITTPRVLAAVRAHFNCPIMLGAEIEGENPTGLLGSAGAHWEHRLFKGEVLSTYAGNAITNLTLSLMEDSGWCASALPF